MRQNKYNQYINKKRSETTARIKEIVSQKGGKWTNHKQYNGTDFPCKITCSKNHSFTVGSRKLQKGSWCSICLGKINYGEEMTRIVLEEFLGFPLEKTRRIPGLVSPLTGHPLEIDGFSFDNNIGFEYQGQQHFKFIPHIHKTEDVFKNQQIKDSFKKKFFKKNKLILIEIKQFDNLDTREVIDKISSILKKLNVKYNKNININRVNKTIKKQLKLGRYYDKINDYLISQDFHIVDGKFNNQIDKVSFRCQKTKEVVSKKISWILKRIIQNDKITIKSLNLVKKTHKQNMRNAKPGPLPKYSKEIAIKIIKDFRTLKDLAIHQKGLYCWLQRSGLFMELTKDLVRLDGHGNPVITLSEDQIFEEAKKYNTRKSFKDENRIAYERARKMKIIDSACSHMRYSKIGSRKLKGSLKYSDDYLINYAKKHQTSGSLKRDNESIYILILKRNLKDTAFAHMVKTSKKSNT